MPLYEYKCIDCSHKFIELQKVNDEPIKECPKCGKEVEKLISIYKTDVNYNNPKEHYARVLRGEIDEIKKKIQSGDETALADIIGEE